MAQNFTYDELVSLAQSYTSRVDADFVGEIDTFIALAENRLATDMKQQGFQTPVTGAFTGSEKLAKPAYWRETISFSYVDASGQRQPIQLRSYDYCRNYNPTASQGAPKYYADYNFNNFLLTPAPDQAYPFELTFYARLDPLSESNQRNWLTDNMPQALLAAMLVEAFTWCKWEDKAAAWDQRYQEFKSAALGENLERMADRQEVVSKG